MKNIYLPLMFLLLVCSDASSQQYQVHSRGMLRQSVFEDGTLGRPSDNGSTGALQNMPSFEWPSNGGYPIYLKSGGNTLAYKGYYNSMGGGFWIAGDTSRYSGSGVTPRVWAQCGASTDASGHSQSGDAIAISVQRFENYPVLSDGELNSAYNPNEAEERIVSKWDTPLGITVTRTSRAWSYPDYDDFIIYEYELENTGSHARTGRLDTISAITIAATYELQPSMIYGMLINNNSWAELAFRGDKAGALSFNYARFNWTRYLMYNHTINGGPFQPQDASDTILTAPGAVGIQPLYYDYAHLANKNETRVALSTGSLAGDSVNLYEMRNGNLNDKVLKQPYAIATDNGNLNLAKFQKYFDIERTRNNVPIRSSNDSATYGAYWLGRAKENWTSGLRNPTGHVYGFGPYTLAPHAKMKFVYAEVAGFGAGNAGDEIYSDMGGGWGTGDHAPCDELQPGVHPAPTWWNTLTYPYLNPKGMDCAGNLLTQDPKLPDYTKMGTTYMQTHRLPDYVNSNVISIRDVADRAIQMWKGGPVVKYDDTSRYMNTFTTRDLSKQFDPSSNPLLPSPAQPTGVFQVPLACPAPAIFVANTGAASNKVIWGTQVDSITAATPGFSRLDAPLSHYLVMRANDPVGPWKVLDSIGRKDPRYFVNTGTIANKGTLTLGDSSYAFVDESSLLNQSYYYSVVSVDLNGRMSGKTNITTHNTQAPAAKKLGHVYAVPNPFVFNSGDFSSSGAAGGNVSDKIGFFGLTKRATIRIFSYSGQLVQTFEHNSATAANPDGEVASSWYQISRNDQWVASGVYFFVVEDKDTGDRAWNKFVIIH